MKDVLAFTLGVDHPSSRMRVAAYAPYFARAGWNLRMHPFDSGMGKSAQPTDAWWRRAGRRLQRRIRTARAVSALRRLDPQQPIIISRELPVSRRPFLNAPNPLVLDVDDALYLGINRTGLDALCRKAQVVICGNDTIAANLVGVARTCTVIPTVVDTDLYAVRGDHHRTGPLRLGWLGSSMSIEQTLLPLADVLRALQARMKFKLVVISDEPAAFLLDVPWVQFIKWSPAVEQAIGEHIDVGIMPLEDNPYQAAKCGAKLLQYMAAGLPVVASPVGVNRAIVMDGTTGYWATSPQEWHQAMERLAQDEKLRASFGQAGREHVVRNYSIARWGQNWVDTLNELA
jgi:glycosyltransferase involved in cell wall biosynthesis